jgi:hypothetical protein
MAAGVEAGKLVHADVLETGARTQDTLAALLRIVLPRLAS